MALTDTKLGRGHAEAAQLVPPLPRVVDVAPALHDHLLFLALLAGDARFVANRNSRSRERDFDPELIN